MGSFSGAARSSSVAWQRYATEPSSVGRWLLMVSSGSRSGAGGALPARRVDAAQPLVLLPDQVVEGQPVPLVGLGQLLDALAQGPLWTEGRYLPGDPVTGDPVVTGVRAGPLGEGDLPADDLLHQLRDRADQVVLVRVADVAGAG